MAGTHTGTPTGRETPLWRHSTTTDSMPDGLRFLFAVEDKVTAALNKINRYLRNL